MAGRIVNCVKLNKELPGLEKAPFAGPLGKQIFDQVSLEAWRLWKEDMQLKVINEYRLNLADSRDYQTLLNQMMAFLNLSSVQPLEVENASRGRGSEG